MEQSIRLDATAPQQEEALGYHRLTGEQRTRNPLEGLLRPIVVPITPIQIGNQGAGIDDDQVHAPNPSR